jgi:hypothetical protein
MKRSLRQIGTILPLLTVSLLSFATPVFANSIAAGLTGFDLLAIWGWKISSVVLLIVMAIEAYVYYRMLSVTALHAIGISFLLNIVSIVFGILLSLFVLTSPLIPLLALAAVIYISWSVKLPVWIPILFIAGAIAGFIPMVSYGWYDGYWILLSISLAIFSAFGITLFAESWAMTWMVDDGKIFKAVLIANVITYVLIAAFTFTTGPMNRWYVGSTSGYIHWESRAKGILRSIGSAELAYQQSNEMKVYGSFDALQSVGDIAEGYTLENMIEDYTMTWEVSNVSTAPTEMIDIADNSFTVIAWPEYRTMLLRTFAITEDQVVRVYTPANDNELDDVKTWDPIL